MILTLKEAKQYLRLEEAYTDEDDEVTSLINAAETYLKNAGCTLKQENELGKLAIKMLVVYWYENRDPVGNFDRLAFGLQNIITQLKVVQTGSGTV